ncbi:MAG: PspC domain-containing protein [Bacteroidia bacterium]|nr:PspC domain-containing protein [Bacteroidia bacterium]
MNRTITMNLSGIIFHIEEDAYDKLNKYLAAIRGYFSNSESKDEIMTDIESRIAEMLQSKVSQTKQAVLMADVESVIAVMGKPEDFADENSQGNNNESQSAETQYQYSGKRRRVFRDPDEKILGGVCSGIANYFDFDPIYLRGAFAISFFVFGTGILLYIILWMIIPEAKTTAEKLEMRGEKVDINNIGKAVSEEFDDLKKRVNNWEQKVNTNENKERVKSSAQRIGAFITDVFENLFKVFGKIFSILLIMVGVGLLVGLLATLFGSGTISAFSAPGDTIRFSLYEFTDVILPESLSPQLIVIGLVLFLGIPLSSMIYSGIKYLFGFKGQNKIVKYTANVLWLFGLGIMIYIGIEIGNDFAEHATTKQNITITQPQGQIMYLDLKPNTEEDFEDKHNYRRKIHLGDWYILSKDDQRFRLAYPSFTVVASDNNNFELVAVKSAEGFDKKEAAYRAKNIEYSVTQIDSTILFNSYYDIQSADKLRGQELKLILKVPLNKVIFLSKRMEKIIYDIDNVNDTYDGDMINRRWIMTSRGLECLDCQGLENVTKHDTIIIPAAPAVPALPK